MAVIPIIQQTWDTTSYVNPTRMNNIETNIGILSKATGIEYSTGVSVKDKIDDVETNLAPKKIDVSITTDATGNTSLDLSTNRPLICAVKKRDSTNTDVAYSSIGVNYYNNAYLVHFSNADGTPYANKTCNITLWYI